MIKPPALRPGDLVAIAAPASPIQEEFLLRGVAEIESLGYRVRWDPDILSRRRYLAGEDDRRAREMALYLADSTVRAIICARGGYGTQRMLPRMPDSITAQAKILCGYSDVTMLHLYASRHFGLVTFYGPMAAWEFARGADGYDRQSFLDAITGGCQTFSGLVPVKGSGRVRGILAGGCLTLLQSAIGTPLEPRLDGTILVLEDEGVKPYQLDRMIHHLISADVLHGVRAIVFGEMPGCTQAEGQGYDLADVMAEVTPKVPVLRNLPVGHAARPATIPLGVEAELDANSGTLRQMEPAVSL